MHKQANTQDVIHLLHDSQILVLEVLNLMTAAGL